MVTTLVSTCLKCKQTKNTFGFQSDRQISTSKSCSPINTMVVTSHMGGVCMCSAILLQIKSLSKEKMLQQDIIQKHRPEYSAPKKKKSQKISFCVNESSWSGHTHSKIAVSCSLGAFFNPATMLCKRLTLCVAEATGVIAVSFSRRYLLPVSGVEGANDLFCQRKIINRNQPTQLF